MQVFPVFVSRILPHLKAWLITYVLIVIAALVGLYPAVLHPATQLQTMPDAGIAPDTYNYLYTLQRFAINLSNLQNPLHDVFQNYPDGLDLIYLDIPIISYVVAAPFAIVVSPIFAYHVVTVMSSVLTGFAVVWWSIIIGIRNRWVTTMTAIAVVLLPFRVMHGIDHPNVASTYTLMLWFVAVDWWLHRESDQPWHYYLLAGVSALLALNSIQHVFIVGILGGVFFVSRIVVRYEWSTIVLRWHHFVLGAVSIGIGLVFGLLPLLSAQPVVFNTFTVEQSARFSATFWSMILPPPFVLWSSIIPSDVYTHIASSEQYISPGVLAYLLASVGVTSLARAYRVPFVLLCLTGILLSFGGYLQLEGTVFHKMPMPAQLLQSLGFGSFRAWARFGGIIGIVICMLAGLGLDQLIRQAKHQYQQVVLLIVSLVLILGNSVPVRLTAQSVPDNALVSVIAALPEQSVVGFVAYSRAKSIAGDIYPVRYLLLQQYVYRSMVFYAHSAHQPAAFRSFERDFERLNQPLGEFVVCRRGITHLFISQAFMQNNTHLLQSPYLKKLQEVDGWHVFALVKCQ